MPLWRLTAAIMAFGSGVLISAFDLIHDDYDRSGFNATAIGGAVSTAALGILSKAVA